ncbi:MAG: LysR family transcriptional regulator [Lachnospiraceae bacterium]|nr:LysR family transcriptional regulator [Lachnospiraceae bacterium]
MNLMYLKYAVEVAACGSINKAAEKLYMDQPNLSRGIKELESSLGVTIFERSSKGMKVTLEGEQFLKYADSILKQVDTLENMFIKGYEEKKKFSVSVPRASYICEAFAAFSKKFADEDEFEIFYKETNALRAIKNVLEQNYRLGIVRYAEQFDKYYKDMLESKGLTYELVTKFKYNIIMSEKSPLADLPEIGFSDLKNHVEIAHADPYVPSLALSEVKKEELPDMNKRIFVFERASQFELLNENTDTFMWVSSIPKKLLKRYGLVQRECAENNKIYKDVIIYKKDYKLSELDKAFITELCRVKRENFE